MNEQNRPIVQEKFATEPLAAGTELDLIGPKMFRVEGRPLRGIIPARHRRFA
jgi:hypothetical protein